MVCIIFKRGEGWVLDATKWDLMFIYTFVLFFSIHFRTVMLEESGVRPHCISGNVERVIFIQNCVPDCQKCVLHCQKAPVGNGERLIYVLHRRFGNPKRLFMAI